MCNTLILQRKLKNIKHGVYYVFLNLSNYDKLKKTDKSRTKPTK